MPLWHMCTTFAVGTPPAQLMSPRQFCTIMDAVGMYVFACACPMCACHNLLLFWYLGNHVQVSFGVAYAFSCRMRVYNDANWCARACFAPSACNCVTLCRMPAWSVHRALDRVFATKSRFCFPYPPTFINQLQRSTSDAYYNAKPQPPAHDSNSCNIDMQTLKTQTNPKP